MVLLTTPCPSCGQPVQKELKMAPHFMRYKAECLNCGTLVPLAYTPTKKSVKPVEKP